MAPRTDEFHGTETIVDTACPLDCPDRCALEVTAYLRAAGRGAEEAEHEAQRRRLAGAVGAEEAEDLAGSDVEVEPVEGAEAAVVFGQVFGVEEHGGYFPTHHRCL